MPGSSAIYKNQDRYYKLAFALAVFTIIYNIVEGLVSVFLGYGDESLTLFGFGVDSFIEVISGIGIAHMVYRIQRDAAGSRDNFERTALRITGVSFYILTAGLLLTSVINIYQEHQPRATLWGVIISGVSIVIMAALVKSKTYAGKKLDSEAILADAECTRICIYMSVVLLISSGIYELTGFPYIDSIGAIGLAILSFKEGKECMEKSRSDKYCSCGD